MDVVKINISHTELNSIDFLEKKIDKEKSMILEKIAILLNKDLDELIQKYKIKN